MEALSYDEVRRMAHRQRSRFVLGGAPSTTQLVDEAYASIGASHDLRGAARAMRKVIADLARTHREPAKPEPVEREDFEAADALWLDGGQARILVLDEAVSRLSARSERLADVVDCRFFAGYSEEQTAMALGLTTSDVRREWAKARAWLYREVGPDL